MTGTPLDDLRRHRQARTLARPTAAALELAQTYRGLFSGAAGEKVLADLKARTLHTVSGPEITSNELFHLEGQRHLVAYILQMIEMAERTE